MDGRRSIACCAAPGMTDVSGDFMAQERASFADIPQTAVIPGAAQREAVRC